MKRSLGRIIGAILILNTMAWGMKYQWRVVESPQTLRVGQSGVIRYVCTFDSSAAEYSAKLKLADNPSYTTSILSEKSQVLQGKRSDTIDLLVTPTNTGTVSVALKALVRYTPSGAVENTVLGRDNLSKEDILEEEALLPDVSIRVGENRATLIGDISLEVSVDKRSVIAHEPLHLSLYLRGTGNLERYIPYELNISGVHVFAEAPQKNITPDVNGYRGEIRQEFALVSEQSFVIPKISIEVFDTQSQKIKRLESEAVAIEVAQGFERSNLLDPPALRDWSGWMRYTLYGGLVVLGIVLGEAGKRLWKIRPRRRKKEFWDGTKNTKELIMLLALSGEKRFDEVIAELEAGTLDLREAKKRLREV
ncbi:MAG: hypothetical protein PHW18_07445 [Sulfuricurvum sp.]|uniref:hypothetical protein n=1 Tax=Sulfuricurvum sp. TaxID=2025608 RepID=UPI0026218D56|nr:hypothetical protein [Sulfuricurvum sp.]MDD2829388.1 hypothetical protein [Sulfuricurvum sp.]MDD4949121.1 hypothetical protein [Sulfuricurvum sp.]